MLVSFLKEEGRRMGVDVSISQNAFHCIEFSYENNIDELKPALPVAVKALRKTAMVFYSPAITFRNTCSPPLKLEAEDKTNG